MHKIQHNKNNTVGGAGPPEHEGSPELLEGFLDDTSLGWERRGPDLDTGGGLRITWATGGWTFCCIRPEAMFSVRP